MKIKFRFYRTRKKEMVYGFRGCALDYVLHLWENEKHVSDPMQFTGLTDKNGVEIYEGDIIDINQTVNGCSKFAILWNEYKWDARYFYDNKVQTDIWYQYNFNDLVEFDAENIPPYEKMIEVVGNIYEGIKDD